MIYKASDKAFDNASDSSSLSSSFTLDSPFLSVWRRGARSPTFVRGLRSVLTAVIALSVGVALVWWLKAGTDDTRPALPKGAPTAESGAAVPSRVPWAHRNDLAPARPDRRR